jgi:hypothetical protein
VLDEGRRYPYGSPVHGVVNGRTVAVCSIEQQVEMDLGYEPRNKDRADLAASSRLSSELSPPYAEGH